VTDYTFEIPVRITVQAALMDDSGVGELLGPFTKWLKLRLADMTVPANTTLPDLRLRNQESARVVAADWSGEATVLRDGMEDSPILYMPPLPGNSD
jgi:hypothetical protein